MVKPHLIPTSSIPGVDEDLIIDILTQRTYSQRREIAFEYERKEKKVHFNRN